MLSWWNALTGLEQIFACIAIPATVLLLLQTILLVVGVGGDHTDMDVHSLDTSPEGSDSPDVHDIDVHDSGLRLFTLRGFVAFFTIFGWSGIVFMKSGMHVVLSVFIALVLGLISMFLIAAGLAFIIKMQSSGTANIYTAVGETGKVYLTIPPKRTGTGKVTLMVSGRLSEYEAVTDEEAPIKTGASVLVYTVSDENTLVVVSR